MKMTAFVTEIPMGFETDLWTAIDSWFAKEYASQSGSQWKWLSQPATE